MTEVSSVPAQANWNNFFSSRTLRRSYSQSSFLVGSLAFQPPQQPPVEAEYSYRIPVSAHSPGSSSPRTVHTDCWDSPLLKPTLIISGPYTVPPASNSIPINDSSPSSLVPSEHAEFAEDDTMVQVQPSRHVDYLSYDWKEDDVRSTWKHILSNRKVCSNSARLENASWRAWAKSKYRLKSVCPESVNWLKDCDVTWLYGPLQTSFANLSTPPASITGAAISKSDSLLNKKPILKKRSDLEIMLRLSPPSALLLNPSAFRQGIGNECPSATTSRERSPAAIEKRHIHFYDKVEQFIAMGVEDADDDEDTREIYSYDDDSSSDDGFLIMKGPLKPKFLQQNNRNCSQTSFSPKSRTIAILPSTTLKSGVDTFHPTELKTRDDERLSWYLSPETFPLTESATGIPLESHDEIADVSWNLPSAFANHKNRISMAHDGLLQNSSWETNGCEEHRQLSCNPRGMSMLCNEGDNDVVAAGLFGRVTDAMNTAKDIAYVLWNVGWEK